MTVRDLWLPPGWNRRRPPVNPGGKPLPPPQTRAEARERKLALRGGAGRELGRRVFRGIRTAAEARMLLAAGLSIKRAREARIEDLAARGGYTPPKRPRRRAR